MIAELKNKIHFNYRFRPVGPVSDSLLLRGLCRINNILYSNGIMQPQNAIKAN